MSVLPHNIVLTDSTTKPAAPLSAEDLPTYQVAVRELCAFAAKRGDLDTRFTPAPTSLQGMDGHREVASRRSATYEREITLTDVQGSLQVRGRADGYDPNSKRVEEVKTHRGDLERMPPNHRFLHWAQAKVYAHLICVKYNLHETDVALVYFDVSSRQETVLTQRHDSTSLASSYLALCEQFLSWSKQELEHRRQRNAVLESLQFPHAQFRPGQRILAAAVYRASVNGTSLIAQAPTGIGKTLATLFPALKACPKSGTDKVLFLTAKTTGRQVALDALRLIKRATPAGSVRVLELVARDKACVYPDKECHGESCPLAKGFYDRLPDARQAAMEEAEWDKSTLARLGTTHCVCPYYLGQELAHWSDVVVADYNHYFSINSMLYAMAIRQEWRFTVLVDEAHNMIERCRSMYTAELKAAALHQLKGIAPSHVRKEIGQIQRSLKQLVAAQADGYAVYADVPQTLLDALQRFTSAVGELLAESSLGLDPRLMKFYFDALHFLEIAKLRGPHTLFDACIEIQDTSGTRRLAQSTICLRNVIPGPHLKSRWKAAHSVALYSATLSPPRFVAEMLGLPNSTPYLDVPSPFAGQLTVHIARHISTRYGDRHGSLTSVVNLMAEQFKQLPGNYLAFFSSFEYLHSAMRLFCETFHSVQTWAQVKRMSEAQREEFLQKFVEGGQGIGFAVLGGVFGEGIDLPGSRLSGAFIATLGLSQVNSVNEQLRRQVHHCLGNGYNYTYLYPGIQKVVQAAGRVVRTTQDFGTVYLMDDRFSSPEVSALLPSWWELGHNGSNPRNAVG